MTNESKEIYSKIKDVVRCELCLDLLVDPVECTVPGCNANFCRLCWNANIYASGDASAILNAFAEEDREHKQAIYCSKCGNASVCQPSTSIVRFLDKLRWYCHNRDLGCAAEIVYSNVSAHYNVCEPISYKALLKKYREQITANESMRTAHITANESMRTAHDQEVANLRYEIQELRAENLLLSFELSAARESVNRNESYSTKATEQVQVVHIPAEAGPPEPELQHPVKEIKHYSAVWSVSFANDGKWLATGSEDNTARVTNLATGTTLLAIQHDGAVWSVSLNADRKLLATGSADNTARVTDLATGKTLRTIQHNGLVYSVSLSDDCKMLATGSDDHTARITDLATGWTYPNIKHNSSVLSVKFSVDGKLLATGSADNTARITDVTTGRLLRTIKQDGWIWSVSFSDDNKLLATASSDNAARVIVVATGRVIQTVKHSGRVLSVSFFADGEMLATGSDDNTARITDVATGQIIITIKHKGPVNSVSFFSNGLLIATGSQDKTARINQIFDIQDNE